MPTIFLEIKKPVPIVQADHEASDGQECNLDVISLFGTEPQSPLVEGPGEEPSMTQRGSQSVSMGGVSFCKPWNDPLWSQGSTKKFLGIVAPAGIKLITPAITRAHDRRDCIHQGIANWESWRLAPVWITASGILLPSLKKFIF